MKPGDVVVIKRGSGLREGYRMSIFDDKETAFPSKVMRWTNCQMLGMVLEIKRVAIIGRDNTVDYVKVLLSGEMLWTFSDNVDKF
jgi:hypothetical protein